MPDSRIAQHLQKTRESLDRVQPEQLYELVRRGAIVVDTRPANYREHEGSLPGALVLERNVLEWRLDPTSPDRARNDLTSESVIIVVCNEGYASSLAAMSLRQIGLRRATDLVGGYRGWLEMQG